MKGKLTLQQRLVLPIILLGLVTLLSNLLAVFSINNVHANAGTIVDEYMVSEAKLEDIRRSMMDIHRLALSHIVAEDHATMIELVQEIKAEEAGLDEKLAAYKDFVSAGEDEAAYQSLIEDYDAFKHALVYLVCASADSKTQEAYAMANGDVSTWSTAAENGLDALSTSVAAQAEAARSRLFWVYVTSLAVSAGTLIAGVALVWAALRIIQKYVVAPIRGAMDTLQDSSQRISGVVSEVRKRTRTSSGSARHLQRQRPEPLRLDGAAFRRPGGNCREHIRYHGQCLRHAGGRGAYGGGMRRHHCLFCGDEGPGRGDGAVCPGGDGGRSGPDGGNYGRLEPGH